jgi:hypothetical protein
MLSLTSQMRVSHRVGTLAAGEQAIVADAVESKFCTGQLFGMLHQDSGAEFLTSAPLKNEQAVSASKAGTQKTTLNRRLPQHQVASVAQCGPSWP